jgi:hypothetical protein
MANQGQSGTNLEWLTTHHQGKGQGVVTDRIRIIPHAPEGIPDCGSFEVWFADGQAKRIFLLGQQ